MISITDEYQEIFQLYLKLGKELTRIMEIDETKNPQTFVESILATREQLVRIEQLNIRVLHLSEDWERHCENADPEIHNNVRETAAAVRAQAVRVNELCSLHVQRLQTLKDRIGRDLAEIGRGTEYLKSVKPIKNNFPKFIDSLY